VFGSFILNGDPTIKQFGPYRSACPPWQAGDPSA
jgi:hypothetical protein